MVYRIRVSFKCSDCGFSWRQEFRQVDHATAAIESYGTHICDQVEGQCELPLQ